MGTVGVIISLVSNFRPPESDRRTPVSRGLRNHATRRAIALVSVLLLIVIVTRLLIVDLRREQELHSWVNHTSEVLGQARQMVATLTSAETGQRGFLLTGDNQYLEPYLAALLIEKSVRTALRQMTVDNPKQQRRLDLLDPLVRAKFEELGQTIRLHRSGQTEAAIKLVKTDEGKRIMDRCLTVLRAMEDDESQFLVSRTETANAQNASVRSVLSLGFGSLLVLLIVAGVVIEQDAQNREQVSRTIEERLHRALTCANAATWEWDLETETNIWSEEMWRLFGLERNGNEPSFESWRRAVHPDDLAAAEHSVREAALNQTELNVEFRVVSSTGAPRWLLSRAQLLKNTDGKGQRFAGITLDISRNKQAEAALQETETQFRTLANAIPHLSWMANADGWIFWYNQRWYEYTGTTPKEMEGWGWQSVHDPSTLPQVLERWQASIASGATFDMVFPLRGADQVFRTFLTRVMPVRDSSGNVTRWFGTNTDISEQRRIEEALRASEKQYRTLFDSMDEGFALHEIICDQAGKPYDARILVVNPAFEHQTGAKAEDVLGRTDLELFPGMEPIWFERYGKVAFTGESVRFEAWLDGLGRWFEIGAFQTEHGRFCAIFTDITRRKRAEEHIQQLNVELEHRVLERTAQLQAANKELEVYAFSVAHEIEERARADLRVRDMKAELERRSMLDVVQDAVVIADAAGNITHINNQGELLFGYRRSELLGQKLEILIPHRFQRHRDRFFSDPRESSVGEGLEAYGVRRDGSEFPAEVRLGPVQTDAGIVAATSVRDITERKRILSELQAKAAEMERFAYTVSHDLKSPLITIKSYVAMIDQDLTAGRFDRARPDLQRVARAADKMHGLLEDVLALSRVGRVEHTLERVAFGLLVEEALELVAGSIAAGNVRVAVAGDLPYVTVDRRGMVEVLQNLIDNAVKFTKDRTDPEILIGASNYGTETRFFVKDNGAGVEAKYHKRIFGLFDKLNPKSEGSGAGLAIVKRIIELHGGRIWVESEGTGGSTFWFTLEEPGRSSGEKRVAKKENDDSGRSIADSFG